MMPVRLAAVPDDKDLTRCIRAHRKKGPNAWKAFRAHPDGGGRALALLHDAYGSRCLYCDHAHARTIDHVCAKTSKPKEQFSWKNWRPVCMDCNNLKGVQSVVDPARADPRDFVVFTLSTGVPAVVAKGRRRAVADRTARLLSNQTVNEARRTMRVRVLDVLERVAKGRPGAKQQLKALLGRETPHRAILRELVLEQDVY